MYYHSTDWGFDANYSEKKNKSRQSLADLSLPALGGFSCTFTSLPDYCTHLVNNTVYLVIVDDLRCSNNRHGYFDIQSIEQLYDCIQKDFKTDAISLQNYMVHFIEQISPCDGCFTGIIMSDGNGNLLCEILNDTVDNRELSSGKHDQQTIKRIQYSGGRLLMCDSYIDWYILASVLYTCLANKGYYELSYGRVGKKNGVYFSYFSSDPVYQNYFNNGYCFDKDSLDNMCFELCCLQAFCIDVKRNSFEY